MPMHSSIGSKMSGGLENAELINIPAGNGIILKSIIGTGVWGCRPTENGVAQVTINNLICTGLSLQHLQEPSVSLYFSQSFNGQIIIGNADSVVDKAVERCVTSMLVGEKSKFTIKLVSTTNHSLQQCSLYPIIIECFIVLEKLSNDYPIHEWSDEKIYEVAMHHKTEGVRLFKNGRKVESFLRFSKSFKFLNLINIKVEDDRDLSCVLILRVALLNNMANCQLDFQNYVFTTELCNKALCIDPNNIKSLYRRATALINIQKFEEAESDLKKILQMEPSNTRAKEKYQELKNTMKEKDANYAAVIKKMFSS